MRGDYANVTAAIMANMAGDQEAVDRHIRRELVKQAVMVQIFCPCCGGILDMRLAALIDLVGAKKLVPIAVICCSCLDKHLPQFEAVVAKQTGEDREAHLVVTDARKLYTSSTKRRKG